MIHRKNILYRFITIALLVLVLAACSDDENNTNDGNNNNNENNGQEENTNSPSDNNKEDNDNNDNNTNENDAQDNNEVNADDETSRSERYGEDEWDEDETGLAMGEAGTLDSNLGQAEITLDSVKWEDADDLEEDAEVTQLISAEITLKNVGDEALVPEDILYSGQLNEEGEEYGDMWDYYEGISEEWDDNLDSGEKTSGIIVFNSEDIDAYELIFGIDLGPTSNKVSFKFENDEVD